MDISETRPIESLLADLPQARCCRHCLVDLTEVSPSARFCPRCGGDLGTQSEIRARHFYSPRTWLAALADAHAHLMDWHPAEKGRKRKAAIDHTDIRQGYGNALYKLGWQYERAPGARQNLTEALRCYFKSARLGNPDATSRIEVAQREDDSA